MNEEYKGFYNPITQTAIDLVAAERKRVIEEEGFNHEHDKQYEHQELVRASVSYIIKPMLGKDDYQFTGHIPYLWPFNPAWYKSTSRVKDLIKGIQFALAELEQELIRERDSQQQKP